MHVSTQIFFGGSDEINGDYSEIHRRARKKRSVIWEAMKHTKKGDRVLIYFNRPHSAIVASAVMLEDSWPADDRPFRGRIGKIKILKDPVTFDELKVLFPKWDWLKYPRSKVYLDAAIAKKLWKRAEGESSRSYRRWRNTGAGFGDPETNRKVEKAAVARVTRELKKKGYSVLSREAERVGYDLEATRGGQKLHVEVKGVSGSLAKFPITAGELNRAKEDPRFRISVVTDALERTAKTSNFTGQQFIARFAVRPISYLASPR
jgi:hypothetical protein